MATTGRRRSRKPIPAVTPQRIRIKGLGMLGVERLDLEASITTFVRVVTGCGTCASGARGGAQWLIPCDDRRAGWWPAQTHGAPRRELMASCGDATSGLCRVEMPRVLAQRTRVVSRLFRFHATCVGRK